MARKTKPRPAAPLDQILRDAFKAAEGQPVPDLLKDHIDRLTGEPPKPPRRN